MKAIRSLLILCIIFCSCSNKYYTVKWRLEPSGINADTIAFYEKEKILKDDYVRVFGDSVKILRADLDSLLVHWNNEPWHPTNIKNISINIDAKTKIEDIVIYKISIQADTFFNEDVAHIFHYSPKYGVIVKMRKFGLYGNYFYSLMSIKDRSSNIYTDIDFEKLSSRIYNDTILYRR